MKKYDVVLFEVRTERIRQIEELRYDAEHDDERGVNEMLNLLDEILPSRLPPRKRSDVLRIQLVRLAALTVATIETLDRREHPEKPDPEEVGACEDCGGSGDCSSCKGNGLCNGCGGVGHG